ncbi:hypothetical protein ABB07_35300 [Streptomyces incarnatus]|uniref:Uncharacterized protein n=1 Tax=Streptomyces incarnatus TaxID=665007 RepID=A0ABM5TW79_9ACTN|nr:hypothetical protein ABB07_35300 [Streptomyces incarnatus]
MGLEVEDGRCADDLAWPRVTDGLGQDTGLKGHAVGGRVVAVVRVLHRVGEDEVGLGLTVDGDESVGELGGGEEGVVAGVGEADLGAEGGGGPLGLLPPYRLDLLEALPLAPRLGGLPALTEGQTGDGDLLAA